MPIKPENKNRYSKDWKQISERIRFVRAGNKCETCGVKNYETGYRDLTGKFWTVQEIMDLLDDTGYDIFCHELSHIDVDVKPIKIVLTVAHLDHQPENNDDSNLKALCQKCHNNYDRSHRNETIKNERNKGQLSIL
jgi:predicted nucleic-acid-binding Zn-ribbon protein